LLAHLPCAAWLSCGLTPRLCCCCCCARCSAKRESEADHFNEILAGLKKDFAKGSKEAFWKVLDLISLLQFFCGSLPSCACCWLD
jgi:hypothetical protein